MNVPSQMNLFGEPEPTDCEYPLYSARSSYSFGCRCDRCRAANGAKRQPKKCQADGCDEWKLPGSGRRYCADHHLDPAEYRPNEASWQEIDCIICGDHATVRCRPDFIAVPVCQECRAYRSKVRSWRGHGLSVATIGSLLEAPACHICGKSVSWMFDPRNRKSLRHLHVDHDHRCCDTGIGCDDCVRGLAHGDCNRDLGHFERLAESYDLDRLAAARDARIPLLF